MRRHEPLLLSAAVALAAPFAAFAYLLNPPCMLMVVASAERVAVSMVLALGLILVATGFLARAVRLGGPNESRRNLARLHLVLAAELAAAGAVLLWRIPWAAPCGVWPV